MMASRAAKQKVIRSNPKALQADVNTTFDVMENEVWLSLPHLTASFLIVASQWTTIVQRTGIEGFYLAVRNSVHQYHEPKLFMSDKAEQFIKNVLAMEPKDLALRFEAWVMSGISEMIVNGFNAILIFVSGMPATSNRQRPLTRLISDSRKLLQDGLSE
jgi:hypothetical protein